MADGRHLENRYYVIFPQWMFRFGRLSAAGCKKHADYGEMVEIETVSRIPICRTFVFRNWK